MENLTLTRRKGKQEEQRDPRVTDITSMCEIDGRIGIVRGKNIGRYSKRKNVA